MYNKFLHKDIKVNEEEQFKIGTEINESILTSLLESNVTSILISTTNSINKGPYLLQTILNDSTLKNEILK